MAISYKSSLPDAERLFVVAIDQYEDGLRKGVLYHGKERTGTPFIGYPDLAQKMESFFQQMQFPRLIMTRRSFESGMVMASPEEDSVCGRRLGVLATFTIRVTQRQNASWQGILQKSEAEETYRFSSFFDMVSYIHGVLCGQTDEYSADMDAREKNQQKLEKYLKLVMECTEVLKIFPCTWVYRFDKRDATRTFVVKPLFFEHNTCQGTLYWRESKKQKSFRSFLELMGMMNEAIRQENEQIEEKAI